MSKPHTHGLCVPDHTGHTDLGIDVLLSFVSTVFVDLIFPPPGSIMVAVGLIDSSENCLWEGPLLRGTSHSSPLPCQNTLPGIQWVLLCFTFYLRMGTLYSVTGAFGV